MASTVEVINNFLANHESPLRVELPDGYHQLYEERRPGDTDTRTYVCFDVTGHRALPGVEQCSAKACKLWEVDIGEGFKVHQNWAAPWKTSRCKGPGDVFDPWVRWDRGQVRI